ncbi:MAG: prephenate dehydratase [Candidatus Nanopelagicales bacterium]|nr:prephenate dehydratase [Candidatus Nanopelagicales bacterium]
MTLVAFQGELGANSHIAINEVFPAATAMPCATFEDAFAAVADGTAPLAMIPIENSLAGRVSDIYHLLPVSGLAIVGEHFLPIRHQLVGVPGARVEDLRTVESHVMALGQCREAIKRLGLTPIVAADTAGSAREVAAVGDPTRAAIASELAARTYGLEVLASNIEDADHNTTRFLVLAREAEDVDPDEGPMMTTMVFRVRNVPAALYKALGGFATNGVNMTKLESYMLDGHFSATQFYADVEGHPEDRGLAFALEELGFFSHEVSILGTYPASPFRRTMA